MKDLYILEYTPNFAKNLRKLPVPIISKLLKKEGLIRTDPFSPILKTHKLSGKLANYWSLSIDYQYRVVFRIIESKRLLLVDVGTHSVYR